MKSVKPSLYCLLFIASCSSPVTSSDTPAKKIEGYLTALEQSDYAKVFDFDWRAQLEVENIKKSKPEALWDTLIQSRRINYAHEKSIDLKGDLQKKLMSLQPKWEILEIRPSVDQDTLAFVQLRYSDPLQSPISQRHRPGFIQHAIIAIGLSTEGFIRNFELVNESIVLWPTTPLRILTVSFRGAGDFAVSSIGGVEPYSVSVSCGSKENQAQGTGIVTLHVDALGGTCRVIVTDKKGTQDRVWLVLNDRERPRGSLGMAGAMLKIDLYGREPWFSSGYWQELFGNSLHASAASLLNRAPN